MSIRPCIHFPFRNFSAAGIFKLAVCFSKFLAEARSLICLFARGSVVSEAAISQKFLAASSENNQLKTIKNTLLAETVCKLIISLGFLNSRHCISFLL
jgi:hypothetical protein